MRRLPLSALALLALLGIAAAGAGESSRHDPPSAGSSLSLGLVRQRLLGGGAQEADDVVLYQLRDRVFRDTPGGRRATELLYDHIGDMAATIAADPQSFRDLGGPLLASWQGPLRELVEGRGASALVTQTQVDSLLDYWNAMEAGGSAPLRLALEREQSRLGIGGWAGLSMDQWLQRVNLLSCAPSDTALCLNGGRFRVEAEWRTPQGRTGRARAVPLTTDTGYFWFFGEANVEAVVKVLDACTGANPRFWVFAAGLTNVEVDLTVADTATGATRAYQNALRSPFQPIQDTAAFATCAAGGAGAAQWRAAVAASRTSRPRQTPRPVVLPSPAWPQLNRLTPLALAPRAPAAVLFGRTRSAAAHAGPCTPGPDVLCLRGGRFRVTSEWQTPQGSEGHGRAVQLTPDTGYFWFFRDGNVEEVVKVLDACDLDQRFWVFAAGLTNVRVVTTVTDTLRDQTRTYVNDQGRAFRPLQDTNAFSTCP